jgi:hypothetical protein
MSKTHIQISMQPTVIVAKPFQRFTVTAGEVWLTQTGYINDYVLRAGQSYVVTQGAGHIVLQATSHCARLTLVRKQHNLVSAVRRQLAVRLVAMADSLRRAATRLEGGTYRANTTTL